MNNFNIKSSYRWNSMWWFYQLRCFIGNSMKILGIIPVSGKNLYSVFWISNNDFFELQLNLSFSELNCKTFFLIIFCLEWIAERYFVTFFSIRSHFFYSHKKPSIFYVISKLLKQKPLITWDLPNSKQIPPGPNAQKKFYLQIVKMSTLNVYKQMIVQK